MNPIYKITQSVIYSQFKLIYNYIYNYIHLYKNYNQITYTQNQITITITIYTHKLFTIKLYTMTSLQGKNFIHILILKLLTQMNLPPEKNEDKPNDIKKVYFIPVPKYSITPKKSNKNWYNFTPCIYISQLDLRLSIIAQPSQINRKPLGSKAKNKNYSNLDRISLQICKSLKTVRLEKIVELVDSLTHRRSPPSTPTRTTPSSSPATAAMTPRPPCSCPLCRQPPLRHLGPAYIHARASRMLQARPGQVQVTRYQIRLLTSQTIICSKTKKALDLINRFIRMTFNSLTITLVRQSPKTSNASHSIQTIKARISTSSQHSPSSCKRTPLTLPQLMPPPPSKTTQPTWTAMASAHSRSRHPTSPSGRTSPAPTQDAAPHLGHTSSAGRPPAHPVLNYSNGFGFLNRHP